MNYKNLPCQFCGKERERKRNVAGKIKKINVTCGNIDCLKKLKEKTKINLSNYFKIRAVELGYGKWSKGRKLSEEHKKKINPTGRKATIQTKLKISKSKIGSKNYQWKGGITKKYIALRNNYIYKHWRKIVFKRDNYTCKICGKRGGINAHHLESVSKNINLIYKVWNGITLCKNCHKQFHKDNGNKTTPEIFLNYFSKILASWEVRNNGKTDGMTKALTLEEWYKYPKKTLRD